MNQFLLLISFFIIYLYSNEPKLNNYKKIDAKTIDENIIPVLYSLVNQHLIGNDNDLDTAPEFIKALQIQFNFEHIDAIKLSPDEKFLFITESFNRDCINYKTLTHIYDFQKANIQLLSNDKLFLNDLPITFDFDTNDELPYLFKKSSKTFLVKYETQQSLKIFDLYTNQELKHFFFDCTKIVNFGYDDKHLFIFYKKEFQDPLSELFNPTHNEPESIQTIHYLAIYHIESHEIIYTNPIKEALNIIENYIALVSPENIIYFFDLINKKVIMPEINIMNLKFDKRNLTNKKYFIAYDTNKLVIHQFNKTKINKLNPYQIQLIHNLWLKDKQHISEGYNDKGLYLNKSLTKLFQTLPENMQNCLKSNYNIVLTRPYHLNLIEINLENSAKLV